MITTKSGKHVDEKLQWRDFNVLYDFAQFIYFETLKESVLNTAKELQWTLQRYIWVIFQDESDGCCLNADFFLFVSVEE